MKTPGLWVGMGLVEQRSTLRRDLMKTELRAKGPTPHRGDGRRPPLRGSLIRRGAQQRYFPVRSARHLTPSSPTASPAWLARDDAMAGARRMGGDVCRDEWW